jgi:phage replication O-like protein O
MANPQLEDGHTRIANELLDNLVRVHLSPYEWQVILFIIRKTYGFQKSLDRISNSQIVQGTGILKTNVSRTLKCLAKRRIITKVGRIVGLQKDYELWLPQPKLSAQVTTPKLSVEITRDIEVINSDNNGNAGSYQNGHKKLSILPSELSKEITKVISPRDTQKKKENIQKKLNKRKHYPNITEPVDPDKFVRGHYGHMVHR